MFTLAICTRGRPDSLVRLIDSLGKAVLNDPSKVFINLIWNDKPGPDLDLARQTLQRFTLKFKITVETKKGLSRCRNVAIANFKGSHIIFLDDDILVPKRFFLDLFSILGKNNIDIAGTRVLLHDEEAYNITTNTAEESSELSENISPFGFIHGCSLILSKAVVLKLKKFDDLLGPGAICKAADDLDYVLRGYYSGFTIKYIPDVFVYHDHKRNTLEDIVPLLDSYAIANGAITFKYLVQLKKYPVYWSLKSFEQVFKEVKVYRSWEHFRISVVRKTIYTLYGFILYPASYILSLFRKAIN